MRRSIILLCLVLCLAGCLRPYTPNIQQGNVLSREQIEQLKLGMTKEDVQSLLGVPVLANQLSSNRWDYIYTFKKGGKPMEEKRLTLYFYNNQLYQMKGDQWPRAFMLSEA